MHIIFTITTLPYQRKQLNRISCLKDSDGRIVEGDARVGRIAHDYFVHLFATQGVINEEDILLGVDKCIIDLMNTDLDRPFTKEDIFSALLLMSPLKASGEDGLGAVFYQHFWHILGDEVAGYCIGLLNGEFPINLINHTYIVLIPKVKSPRSMMNFCPISLCNVLYKIASNALVNRFQEVLQFCIDEAQSAFVPGRPISDNIVAAYEFFHSMKNRTSGNEGSFALKLDMSKAYDRIE
ncbi:hypothetical protein J1N35_015655 [Gossypium stocksii]|uniref:Reverse transcriptase domain-containing protein n=1 Tax=Gossypium stocksii TaxID=47602 RepID=A0A9D4AAJ6_9ROSI|nr:hypothetical protein J1N35_015655 [Gossypium stocksii]